MYRESTHHPHVTAERAHLFLAPSSASLELEYLTLFQALIGVLKPYRVLEIGAGASTLAIHRTLLSSDPFASLVVVEPDPNYTSFLPRQDNIFIFKSLDDVPEPMKFDLVLIDSRLPQRAAELRHLLHNKMLAPRAVIMIHDTSPLRTTGSGEPDPETRLFYSELAPLLQFFRVLSFPLSRGCLLLQPRHDLFPPLSINP